MIIKIPRAIIQRKAKEEHKTYKLTPNNLKWKISPTSHQASQDCNTDWDMCPEQEVGNHPQTPGSCLEGLFVVPMLDTENSLNIMYQALCLVLCWTTKVSKMPSLMPQNIICRWWDIKNSNTINALKVVPIAWRFSGGREQGSQERQMAGERERNAWGLLHYCRFLSQLIKDS